MKQLLIIRHAKSSWALPHQLDFDRILNERGRKQIVTTKTLYHASSAAFYAAIATIPEKSQTAAIFSHNPGITEFVNELTDTHIDNMPTCGIFGVQFDSDDWLSFEGAKKSFWLFDYPKG